MNYQHENAPRILSQVVTSAEIEREFGLARGTVRQYLYHNRGELNPAHVRKADGRTWLLTRQFACEVWGGTTDN